jgi:uncharacterized membrane protein
MGLAVLVAGLVLFLANHLFVTRREARAAVIARIGKPVYFALFGIISLVALALVVWGYASYRAHEWIDIWQPPAFMRHITILLMLFAVIFATATFIPSHIKALLKFPMLTAVKTWALAHLLSNGDLGSILMFAAFLAWAVIARISLKRRADAVLPVAPAGYTNDVIVVLVGVVVYLAIGYAFHPAVIGVPVFGR